MTKRERHAVPKRSHLRRQEQRTSRSVQRAGQRPDHRTRGGRPVSVDANLHVTVVVGEGCALMPGLIDMHWHAMLVRPTPAAALTDDLGYTNMIAGNEATDTLMRGFSTVRDLGGPVFGQYRAISEGVVVGPRLSFRCHDLHHRRAWGLPPALRSAESHWWPAEPHGAHRRQHDRRQEPAHSVPAGAREK